MQGTGNKPRLSVYKSLNNIYAQLIDDAAGKTILSASSMEKEIRAAVKHGGNLDAAKKLADWASTKKANELMAHTYSHVHSLNTTGLRFFTVYGPWGRPDMSAMIFARAIVADQPIEVFNHGDMQRDFTYIDDIVEGVIRTLDRVPDGRAASGPAHRPPHSCRASSSASAVLRRTSSLVPSSSAAMRRPWTGNSAIAWLWPGRICASASWEIS